jgi:hypothetical protein
MTPRSPEIMALCTTQDDINFDSNPEAEGTLQIPPAPLLIIDCMSEFYAQAAVSSRHQTVCLYQTSCSTPIMTFVPYDRQNHHALLTR